MTILIFVFFLVLSFFYPRSKKLATAILLFVWILFGWNFSNGDYTAYESLYNSSTQVNYELGFQYLINIAKSLGFSFQDFLILCSCLIILLWARFIFLFSYFPAFFCTIFLIIFLPLDFVLLRNSISFSIVMQGLVMIFNTDLSRLKRVSYFLIFVIIASFFHKSSVFYLLLTPIFYFSRINFYKIFIILLCAIGVYLTIAKPYLYSLLQDSGERSIIYQSNFVTFISLTLYQFFGTYLIYLFYKVNEDDNRLNTLLKINYLMLLVIVLYYDFSIFVRLYRNIVIINTIFAINVLLTQNTKSRLKPILWLYVIIYLLIVYFYFVFPFQETTIEALFYKNLIID